MACKANKTKSAIAIWLMLFTSLSEAESTRLPIKAGKINEAVVDNNKKKSPKENSIL